MNDSHQPRENNSRSNHDKEVKKPKMPLSAYQLWKMDNFESIKAKNPDMNGKELNKEIRRLYDNWPRKELVKYEENYNKARINYEKELEEWRENVQKQSPKYDLRSHSSYPEEEINEKKRMKMKPNEKKNEKQMKKKKAHEENMNSSDSEELAVIEEKMAGASEGAVAGNPNQLASRREVELLRIISDKRIKFYNMIIDDADNFIDLTRKFQEGNAQSLAHVLFCVSLVLYFQQMEPIEEKISLIAQNLKYHPYLHSLTVTLGSFDEVRFSIPLELAVALNNLCHLQTFEINLINEWPNNTDEFFKTLLISLGRMTKLTLLGLYFVNIRRLNDMMLYQIMLRLRSLSNLKTLSLILDKSSISDCCLQEYFTIIQQLDSLVSVWISVQKIKNITDDGISIKFSNNFKNKLIDFGLNVRKTQVRFRGLWVLLNELVQCPNLKALRIYADWAEVNPRLSDVFLRADNLKSLRVLNFGCCWQDNNSSLLADQILMNFKSIKGLQELFIEACEYSDSKTNFPEDQQLTSSYDSFNDLSTIRTLVLFVDIEKKGSSWLKILEYVGKIRRLENLALNFFFSGEVNQPNSLDPLVQTSDAPILCKEEFRCLNNHLGTLKYLQSLKIIIYSNIILINSEIDYDIEDLDKFIGNINSLTRLTQLHLSLQVLKVSNPSVLIEFSLRFQRVALFKLHFLTDFLYNIPILLEFIRPRSLTQYKIQEEIIKGLVSVRMKLVTMAKAFHARVFRLAVRNAVKNEIFCDFIAEEAFEVFKYSLFI